MGENPLMGVLSSLTFLVLLVMMDRLGLIISCVSVCAGEMDLGLELGLVGFNLAEALAELMSYGVEPSLFVCLTFLRVQKYAYHCAPHLRRLPLGAMSGASPKSLRFPAYHPL